MQLEAEPWARTAAPLVLNPRAICIPGCVKRSSELMQSTKAPEGDVIRSKGLASAWSAIDEAELKAAALASIRSLWQANDWWDEPPGRSARKAKAIYQPGD